MTKLTNLLQLVDELQLEGKTDKLTTLAIELDKHWNDNSGIRSDLRVNPRWQKLMYDNYEGRKQT